MGRGAEGNKSAGGYGSYFPAAGWVHPPGSTAHHLHPAGRGSHMHTHKRAYSYFISFVAKANLNCFSYFLYFLNDYSDINNEYSFLKSCEPSSFHNWRWEVRQKVCLTK